MSKDELILKLQDALTDAIEGWGVRHDMSCVTMPPWDQDDKNCDCGRAVFIKKCQDLLNISV
jgi:hypothetical protein